jgi:hypothetical protein
MKVGSSIWYDVVKQDQLMPKRRFPMEILSQVAEGMQEVLTEAADMIGHK